MSRAITAAQRRAWKRRADTILAKAEGLLSDMILALGDEHPITDRADNVVDMAQDLADAADAMMKERGS